MSSGKRAYGLNPEYKKGGTNWRWLYLPFMLLLGLGASAWATQQVAAYYSYHSALGAPWFVQGGMPWYAPWSVFFWQSTLPDDYGVIEHTVTLAQAMFLVPQFVILGCWFARRRLKGNEDLHGSARWAEEEDIQKMGFLEGKGVYVGGWLKRYPAGEQCRRVCLWLLLLLLSPLILLWSATARTPRAHAFVNEKLTASPPPRQYLTYLRHDGPEHIMAFMPTRSGKGVCLIIPTLLVWPGSSTTLDIKGENWALTSGRRKAMGHITLRFDPSDASGAGACFNPLDEIRLDTLQATQDVQNLAMMLVDPECKGLASHWDKAAFAFFSGLILHACIKIRHEQGRMASPYDLVMLMADESRTTEELLEEMLEMDHAAVLREIFKDSKTLRGCGEAHAFIASSAREMLNKDEKEASGVLSSALAGTPGTLATAAQEQSHAESLESYFE